MNLRHRLKQVFSGSFIRDVAKLSLGTVAGRVVTVAALPLLTRLYSPEDFALLATFVAIVSTIAVAACLRFEIAIPLAENDHDAKHLVMLSLLALATVTLLVLVAAVLLSQQLTNWTGQPKLKVFIWLIPFGIAALGLYSITQFWATRARRFTQIAQTRISQAVVGVTTSLSLGWAGIAPLGLLLGNILNTSAGSLRLAHWSIRNESHKLTGSSIQGLKETLVKFKRYPIYSTPESLFNTASVHFPIILVAAYAGAEAGFLMLAMQIMAAPMSLLGRSIAQVYVSRASQVLQEKKLANFTRTIMLRLLKLGLLPFALAAIFSPWLVPFIFGENWERTGEIIRWLVPWLLLQFLVSPVSMALHVTGQQALAMMLQVFGFLLRLGAVVVAANIMPIFIVEVYAISGAVFYLTYWFTVSKTIGGK